AYSVEMHKEGCSVLSNTVNINVLPAPLYSYTMSDVDICDGTVSTLNANPQGNYNYQWQVNGTEIPGATNSTYFASTGGDYRVLVSTAECTDTSLVRNLAWYPLPQPVINSSNLPTLTTAPGHQSYQWYRYGFSIPNTNNNVYVTTQ